MGQSMAREPLVGCALEDIAMRTLPLGGALIMLATSATAQTRPSTLAMSCQSARGIVAARGAVVLGTGGMTYSRFVSNGGACDRGQRIEPAWVPTGDGPQCFIGYRCRDTDLDNGR